MRDVGIVMPVYNQVPAYLELALRTVLNQTYKNFHFVIVSDGASKETVDVIKKVTNGDPRVSLIIKDKNEGVAKTLNTGFDFLMKVKEVKYLTWVSSDNKYYPTFLEKLREGLINSSNDVGLSFSSFVHVDDNGVPLSEPQYKNFHKYQDQPLENLLDACFIGVSFMYKKQYAAMIDGYHLEPVEDYEYWLRLTDHCGIVYVPEVLMDYRTNSPKSVSAQLKNSVAQHRRWRYAFNLAKHQARMRNGIPFQLTIIFPIQDGFQQTLDKLEKLYEQYYSNYKVIIIDRSPNKSGIGVLQHVSDPRVKFLWLPGVSEKECILRGMKEADTLFTMIYGKGVFPSDTSVLYLLMKYHNEFIRKGTDKNVVSIFDISGGAIQARSALYEKEPAFGHLYQTEKLRKILKPAY